MEDLNQVPTSTEETIVAASQEAPEATEEEVEGETPAEGAEESTDEAEA